MISCAAPAAQVDPGRPALALELSRFMREAVNVPFSFVQIEAATEQRDVRVHRAATVLRAAAQDLIQWSDPPVASEEGREVFYAYAQNLEFHSARLEDAAAHREDSAESVEQIRQTCNHCHRYFRPASFLSPDVAYDWYALELGGVP